MQARRSSQETSPSVRVAILIASLAVAGGVAWATTGSVLPQDPASSLIFQNGLLLVVLGSLLEPHYTKPVDSLVNSLTGVVTLVGVRVIAPNPYWWVVFGYCLLVFCLSTACVYASSHRDIGGWRKKLASWTFGPSTLLGRSRLIFSVLFLFGLFSFYTLSVSQTTVAVYIVFWGLFVAMWPLGLPEWLSGLRPRARLAPIGRVVRTDWPDLVHVKVEGQAMWDCSSPKVVAQPDGRQRILAPLYSTTHGDALIGTGLCLGNTKTRLHGCELACVYDADGAETLSEGEIAKGLGGSESSRLIGFVVEGSDVAQIRFETWSDLARQGLLVWCAVGATRVHYQITNGVTHEEAFEANRHGRQIAQASQLGVLDDNDGFITHPWLPRMNTPVFADDAVAQDAVAGDFVYGKIPGTNITVGGPFADNMTYHTAILGVTGAGKTELAFDMLRHAVQKGIKVICIDLTAKYRGRLKDLYPVDLSVTEEQARALEDRLFDVDTGKFRADCEKRNLKKHVEGLRADIEANLQAFLSGQDKVGIITLYEFANTEVTIRLTEMYLTCLLTYARDHPQVFPGVLVVVEEAHTVMPEASMAGLGSYDARGLVNKVSQIALQGRKYNIGLLVVTQRTATVSKSVLTQCNTVISFACFDNTSLDFLSNVYGREQASLLPNLGRLQVVAYGKGVRSERPVMVEIRYEKEKALASEVLRADEGDGELSLEDEEIPF